MSEQPKEPKELSLPFESQFKEVQEVLGLVQDLKVDPNVPVIMQTFVDVLVQVEAIRLALKSPSPGLALDAVISEIPKLQNDAEKLSAAVKSLYADMKAKHPDIVKLPPPSQK